MGVVSSRPDDGAALYLKDQHRLTISSLVISSPRKRGSVTVVPNAFPATRVSASRPLGEHQPIEFVQDPEATGIPSFLLKLTNYDELFFTFNFIIRQTTPPNLEPAGTALDTQIHGLTFVHASNAKEVENLVTREFHADPNLHKNSNVELVGDYGTGGSPSVSFEWTWRWKPPKGTEDKGGGWRTSCSFVEYDQRAHALLTLASFSFWVSNPPVLLSQPNSPSPMFQLNNPPKIRVASAQSVESRISAADQDEPASPETLVPESEIPVANLTQSREPVKVDIACPRPGEDLSVGDDGPVFRATMKALEQKTGNMRQQLKRVLKKAENAQNAQVEANEAFVGFMEALREASSTNANAVQPAIDHYFDKIAREILAYERQNAASLQKIVIDPLTKLYAFDVKQAESKKRDFEEESKDYYAYVARYLGQRQDSVKAKKLAESDSKYQTKRRNFELKRFDYSSFMQDLHGGRKEQEVLSQLTRYADAQTRSFLATAKKVEALLPQLEALSNEVEEANKEFQFQRREREEKRRFLEKSNKPYVDPEPLPPPAIGPSNGGSNSDTELGRADSTGSQPRAIAGSTSANTLTSGVGAAATDLSRSPGSLNHGAAVGSPAQSSKFRGIRDLEERDHSLLANADKNATQRKEGLLWALNRPGSHVDPRALNKQGWHKFWIVLDQGKLSEYSNWKQKLDLHMDPIDLRMASVREARNAERRFCFEVITPHFKRVYQATSEEDMSSWITAINNALQSAVEGRGIKDRPTPSPSPGVGSTFKTILTGKSPSLSHGHGHPHGHGHSHGSSTSGVPVRRTTVGSRPTPGRTSSNSFEENPDKLLQMLRDNDQGNCWCADCGSGSKVEWVSINLAIILCIECSGIHRSLGTHISKIRSLTLDITSFTPDIVELLLLVGNRVSNMVWEARMDPSQKPSPTATREQRLRFITAKYVDHAFVEPLPPSPSSVQRQQTPEDVLIAAVKRNEVQQVLYALALRANPNATDRSRDTHAVYLALAAADPAPPSSSGSSTSGGATSSSNSSTTTIAPAVDPATSAARTVPFPVAEMLLQNGAEIPATGPPFPLGRAAQLYLEAKRGRAANVHTGGAVPVGGPATITVVASETSGGGNQLNGLTNVKDTSSAAAIQQQQQREMEQAKASRLQKRISAGGRLAKTPILEK